MKKALITGPTGAAGTALTEELVRHGISVTAVCRPGSKRRGAVLKHRLVNVIECGLHELSRLPEMLSDDYDVFFHFAWDGTYGQSRQDLYLQARNILYTLDAVHAAARLGCRTFIGAGSQSEFGHTEGKLHPDMPCSPDNGYGIAKLDAGRMSRLECRKAGLRHIWCRIVSMYGPHDGPYTMIMSGIWQMLKGQRPQYTKAEQVWDYIYSRDAARAFRLAAEKGRDGAVYCIGTGQTRKLREFICAVRDAVSPGMELTFGELDYYPDQVMHLEADITSLTLDTGFVPLYTFEEGIRETAAWAAAKLQKAGGGCG